MSPKFSNKGGGNISPHSGHRGDGESSAKFGSVGNHSHKQGGAALEDD
jgi:hypothetical protein